MTESVNFASPEPITDADIDAQAEQLFVRMRCSESIVDSEFDRLLRFGQHSPRWHMRLHLLRTVWHVWNRRSAAAHLTATFAIVESVKLGATDWQLMALGWRAVAHIESGAIAEGIDDLMEAELLLSDLKEGVAPADMSKATAGALEAIAIAYSELSWFSLAVQRQRESNAIPGNPFTGDTVKTRGLLSLALLEWRWAMTVERMGLADPIDRAEYESHLSRSDAVLTALRNDPRASYPNDQIHFLSDLVGASLVPEVGIGKLMDRVDAVGRTVNDRAVVLCRIAHAARMTGRREMARDYAAQALAMMSAGDLMPAAAEEVKFQKYLADLNSDPRVQDQSTDYVMGVNRRVWAQSQRMLDAYQDKLTNRRRERAERRTH